MASRPLPLPSPVRGPRSALPGAKPPRGASGAQEGNGTKAKQAKPEQLFCWTRRDVGQFGRCGCAWWQARRALLLGVALAAGLLMWEARSLLRVKARARSGHPETTTATVCDASPRVKRKEPTKLKTGGHNNQGHRSASRSALMWMRI
eukprot:XP_001700913.1 predicted protein [Chlamydomonas reinhardtii]